MTTSRRAASMRSALGRAGPAVAWTIGWTLALAVVAEGGLRVAGWLARHAEGEVPAGRRVVLCDGDSFTYGLGGVSYPRQLEEALNRRAGGPVYRAVNQGIPDATLEEVVDRLEAAVPRLRPETVIVIAGDGEMRDLSFIEHMGSPWAARLDRKLRGVKVYKLAKLLGLGLLHRFHENRRPDLSQFDLPGDVRRALYRARGDCLAGRVERGIAAYERALDGRYGNELHLRRAGVAECRFRSGDVRSAAEMLSGVARFTHQDINPGFPLTRVDLLSGAAGSPRRDVAPPFPLSRVELEQVAEVDKILAAADGEPALRRTALLARAAVDYRRAEFEDAIRSYRDLLALEPASVPALVGLGRSCLGAGRRDEALGLFRKALSAAPRDPEAQLGLAMVHAAAAQWPRAVERLRQAVRGNPDRRDTALLGYLAFCYSKAGREEDAVATVLAGLRDNPAEKHLYGAGTEAFMRLGRWADGIALAKRGLRLHPESRELLQRLVNGQRFMSRDVLEIPGLLGEDSRLGANALYRTLLAAEGEARARKKDWAALLGDYFDRQLARLQALTDRQGARLVLSSYPVFRFPLVEGAARARGIRYIDLTEVFRRRFREPRDFLAADFCHCNTAGYGLMAEVFAAEILGAGAAR